MAIKDALKINRKTYFNPSGWLGYSFLKQQFRFTINVVKSLFVVAEPTHTETFDEAMTRLNLNENDIKKSREFYWTCALAFLALGVAAFLGTIYMLFVFKIYTGFLLGVAASALFFANAFRYHFLYFQIKHRKLGCTFEEWRQGKTFD